MKRNPRRSGTALRGLVVLFLVAGAAVYAVPGHLVHRAADALRSSVQVPEVSLPSLNPAALAHFISSFDALWQQYLLYRVAVVMIVGGSLVLLLWLGVPAAARGLREVRRRDWSMHRLRRFAGFTGRAFLHLGAWVRDRLLVRDRAGQAHGPVRREQNGGEQAYDAVPSAGVRSGPHATSPLHGRDQERRRLPAFEAFDACVSLELVIALRMELASEAGKGGLHGLTAPLRTRRLLTAIIRDLEQDVVQEHVPELEKLKLLWGMEEARGGVGRTRSGALKALEQTQEHLEGWLAHEERIPGGWKMEDGPRTMDGGR